MDDVFGRDHRIKQATKHVASTLAELCRRVEDTDSEAALAELKRYNAAVRRDIPFNPNVKDGRCTEGPAMPKSNWANTIDTPPFEAYAVMC
jgi:tricarballylate dehydrogenase